MPHPSPIGPQQTATKHTAAKHQPATHATIAHLNTIDQLRRAHSNQVGFLPVKAIIEAIHQRRTLIQTHNGEVAAYALWTHRRSETPNITTLVHLVVTKTARRQGIATAILQQLHGELAAQGTAIVQAWCRIDLPATAFFRSSGYRVVLASIDETARQQPRQLWRYPLNPIGDDALWIPPTTFGQRRNRTDTIITPQQHTARNRRTISTRSRPQRPGPPVI
jgi:hypothetical protein